MKYLTKSRFKLGLECPTKLFYDANRADYHNQNEENSFLEALAKGGHQIGEMAKLLIPGGVEIEERDHESAIAKTRELLDQGVRVLYEPAFKVGNRFIRVDVLVMSETQIQLIEVKSKSVKGKEDNQFLAKGGKINSKWRPYLADLAFQHLVLQDCFPGDDREIIPCLMCPDKELNCSIDGLHQLFKIKQDQSGRSSCQVITGVSKNDLGTPLLVVIELPAIIQKFISDDYYQNHTLYHGRSFTGIVLWYESLMANINQQVSEDFSNPGIQCKNCQFFIPQRADVQGKKDGFHSCFSHNLGWATEDFRKPKMWDVWDFRGKQAMIDQRKWFMDQLEKEDIDVSLVEPDEGEGLTRTQRQWVQVKHVSGEIGPYFDRQNLRSTMATFRPPYHFIDFETTAPAIPFFKDYSPYEGICFQFSHHQLEEDGTIAHKHEFLGLGAGTNPCFQFITKLYDALAHDQGTIFMYATHENTYLNYMIRLLTESDHFDLDIRDEYLRFLKSIAKPTDSSPLSWDEGPRMMVDMAQIIRKNYWHPLMKGSNSIKKVLPAILNHSEFLQNKYIKPMYGTSNMSSFNFSNHSWITFEDGQVQDPYRLLPKLEDLLPADWDEMERVCNNPEIADGGAAMTAWAYMQFADISKDERDAIAKALKMYCELDTMAMVMIYEGLETI